MPEYTYKAIPLDDGEEITSETLEALRGIEKTMKRFRNSVILKFGIIVVTVKVVDVIGKIALEKVRNKNG